MSLADCLMPPRFRSSRLGLVRAAALLAALAALVSTSVTAVAQREADEQPEMIAAPDGTTAEIIQFIEGLTDEEPQAETEEETIAAQLKLLRSIAAAAEKALAAGPADGDEEAQARYYRLQALALLTQLEEPGAEKALSEAIAAARKSDSPDVQSIGMKFFIESQLMRWNNLSEDDQTKFLQEILATLEAKELDGNDAHTVQAIADFLASQEAYAMGAKFVKQAVPLFRKADFARRDVALADLEGIARRLALPGNEIELQGQYLNGDKFDWSAYEGKVVLVDYWAVWCGYCLAEFPNMKRMYEDYHDQGFEILGVSLDDDPADAAALAERKSLPWRTISAAEEGARGFQDPNAVRYGVTGIPLAILVDRDGKVVSMTARGANLKKLLHDLLGPPGKSAEKEEPAS